MALKESEERLKMAIEGGNLGSGDWNLETGRRLSAINGEIYWGTLRRS